MSGWRIGALSALGLVLIAGSLGVKATATGAVLRDQARFDAEVIARLRAQGFTATREHRYADISRVHARRGRCRLLVQEASRVNEFDAVYRLKARSYGPLRYRYRGAWRAPPSEAVLQAESFVQRLSARLGIFVPISVPVAIAGSPGCNLDAIDFGPLELSMRRV